MNDIEPKWIKDHKDRGIAQAHALRDSVKNKEPNREYIMDINEFMPFRPSVVPTLFVQDKAGHLYIYLEEQLVGPSIKECDLCDVFYVTTPQYNGDHKISVYIFGTKEEQGKALDIMINAAKDYNAKGNGHEGS